MDTDASDEQNKASGHRPLVRARSDDSSNAERPHHEVKRARVSAFENDNQAATASISYDDFVDELSAYAAIEVSYVHHCHQGATITSMSAGKCSMHLPDDNLRAPSQPAISAL